MGKQRKTAKKGKGGAQRPGFHSSHVRIPESLWVRFVAWLGQQRPRRSATQQIVFLIEECLGDPPGTTPIPPRGRPRKRP
jgi:hypothetical protein